MIGPGTTRKATTQGTASSRVNSIARFCEWLAPASSPAVILRAGDGKVLKTYDGFSFLMKADK